MLCKVVSPFQILSLSVFSHHIHLIGKKIWALIFDCLIFDSLMCGGGGAMNLVRSRI